MRTKTRLTMSPEARRLTAFYVVVGLLVFTGSACGGGDDDDGGQQAYSPPPPPPPPPPAPPPAPPAQQQQQQQSQSYNPPPSRGNGPEAPAPQPQPQQSQPPVPSNPDDEPDPRAPEYRQQYQEGLAKLQQKEAQLAQLPTPVGQAGEIPPVGVISKQEGGGDGRAPLSNNPNLVSLSPSNQNPQAPLAGQGFLSGVTGPEGSHSPVSPFVADLIRQAQAAAAAGEYRDATQFVDRALAIQQTVQAYVVKTQALLWGPARDYNQAVVTATKALAIDPENPEALALRGAAYNRLGRYEDAISDLSKAITASPKYAYPYEELAWAQLKTAQALGQDSEKGRRRMKLALENATRAIELNPHSARAYSVRAAIREAMGDAAGALADMRKAAELDPRYRRALARMEGGGRVYQSGEDDASFLDGFVGGVRQRRSGRTGLVAGLLLSAGAALGLIAFLARRRARAPAALAAEATGLPADKYELVRIIGRGGMGEVYEAVDRKLGRTVAIKKMSAALAEVGPQAREYFLKEARTVASLHHPAIVDIYEVLERGSDVYMVFEFVKGKTVQQMLVESKRLSLQRSAEILRPVCKALSFAHGQGMVHRDLKPANIMVTDEGFVKLMDFGIAHSVTEHRDGPQDPGGRNDRTSVAGTPLYMAPELETGVVRTESDVYSLGVCLYEMLTGVPPYLDAQPQDQKREMDFVPPGRKVPGLPRAVDELVIRALQPDPVRRIDSAADFLARLEAAAEKAGALAGG